MPASEVFSTPTKKLAVVVLKLIFSECSYQENHTQEFWCCRPIGYCTLSMQVITMECLIRDKVDPIRTEISIKFQLTQAYERKGPK